MRKFFILFFNFAALAFKDRYFLRCPKWILCGASGVPRGPTRSIAPQRATHAPTVPAVLFYAASCHWSTEIFRESHKMHGFAEKKLADTSAAGAGGAGESPFRRECAARPEEWRRKAEPRKYHTRGMSCSKEVLAEKSQAPQKKEEIHLEFCNFPLQSLANF